MGSPYESPVLPNPLDGPPVPPVVLPPPRPRRLRDRRWFKVTAVVAAALLVLVGAVAAALFAVTESLGNGIRRVPDVFTAIDPAQRPAGTGQLTFLLVARDSGAIPAPRDVFMLATANQDRTVASVVAIPPNTRVAMPGHGLQRLDAAEALGGPTLQVQAVEQLTGIHVDHYAVIDFGRLGAAVNELGGIDVGIAQAATSGGVSFVQGTNHLDGAGVLAYLRQPDLPRGDLDRAQRQQAVMRGGLYRVMAEGSGGPVGVYNLIDAVAEAVSVDDTVTNNYLRGLGLELRGLRPAETAFLTAPVGLPAEEGAVLLDEAGAAALWEAVRTGSVGAYAAQHPADVLGGWAP